MRAIPLILAMLLPAPAQAGPVVVVVPATSEIEDISFNQLKLIFAGDSKRLPNGDKAVPINLAPRHRDRVRFDEIVLQKSADEIGQYWLRRKIQGKGAPPKALRSPKLISQYLGLIPGGISYVDVADLTPKLKPLTIDGKRYGSEGYPLEAK